MNIIEKIYTSTMTKQEKIDLLVREGTHTMDRAEKEIQKAKKIAGMIRELTGR